MSDAVRQLAERCFQLGRANYLPGWDDDEHRELAQLVAQAVDELIRSGEVADFAADRLTLAFLSIATHAAAIESESGLPMLGPDDYRNERNPLE